MVREVMTSRIISCPPDATIADVARLMRDNDIGDVVVTSDDRIQGIVTDRDIVVRCLADGATSETPVRQACSADVASVTSNSSIDEAVRMMRDRAIRRMPVVDDGAPVGIVSLGDLAIERDGTSALADISAARPNA
jgi:CBS domain-containing protein